MTSPPESNKPTGPRKRRWIVLALLLLALIIVYPTLKGADWEGMLAAFSKPYVELMEQNQGVVGPNGETEYLLLPSGDVTDASRAAFLARNPDIQYVGEGEIPSTLVIRIPAPARERAQVLRDDPFVTVILTNRMGVFCH